MADLKDPGYWDTAILRAAGRLMMLAAFESAPGHGYDIARRLRGVCGEWCNPSPAMIYPAIHELEAEGLIACEAEVASGRTRRVCHLTDDGREALRVGAEAWGRFLPAMERLLADQGVTPGETCCGSPE
jgi:DNA-binding PadR family transcriptional regulator